MTADLRAIVSDEQDERAKPGSHGLFRVYDREALDRLPPPTWVVGGNPYKQDANYLTDGLTVLYGPSGAGKSLVAIEWATYMATGQATWLGAKVRTGPVVYICTEAVRSVRQRVAAYEHRIGERADIWVVDAEGLSLQYEDHCAALAEDVRSIKPTMVVVDTYANCMGGDENSVMDTTAALNGLHRIHVAANPQPAMVVVHHSGWDDSVGRRVIPNVPGVRMRGSTALKGRIDAAICIEPYEDDPMTERPRIRMTCAKVRDAEPFHELKATRVPYGGSVAYNW